MPYVVRLDQETLNSDHQLIDFFFREDGSLTTERTEAHKFPTNGLAKAFMDLRPERTKMEEVQCS